MKNVNSNDSIRKSLLLSLHPRIKSQMLNQTFKHLVQRIAATHPWIRRDHHANTFFDPLQTIRELSVDTTIPDYHSEPRSVRVELKGMRVQIPNIQTESGLQAIAANKLFF